MVSSALDMGLQDLLETLERFPARMRRRSRIPAPARQSADRLVDVMLDER